MKSRFLFLVMFLGVALFSGCNDDDDEKAVTYKGENLALLVGDFNLSGREAVLDGSSLMVKKALPGEAETVFAITRTESKIVGANSNANRDVALEGVVDGNKLGLNLTAKMKSSMTAKWTVSSLVFMLDTDQESVDFMGSPMTPDDFRELVNDLLAPMIPMFLPGLTLQEDGNVVASYAMNIGDIFQSQAPIYGDSPKGMALHNVVADKLYIALNISGIVADATAPKEASANQVRSTEVNPLLQLVAMADEGMPLLMRTKDEGVDVYVNKEMMLPIVKMLPILMEAFGEDLGDMKDFVSALVNMVVSFIENSNETEIGLHLVPYVETPAPAASMVMPQAVEKMMQKFAK